MTPALGGNRVLVTGAAGFLGRALIKRAHAAGVATCGLDRHPGPYVDIVADLCKPSAWEDELGGGGFSQVFHMAGAPRATDPIDLMRAHVETTHRLIDSISGSSTVLFLPSTVAVYGPQETNENAIDEMAPCQPANDYAESKLIQEHAALERADEIGDVCIMRISNPIGAGQPESFFVARLVSEALQATMRMPSDRVVEMGSLSGTRDFIDIRDLVDAVWLLMEKREAGIFNLASGRETPLRNMAKLVTNIVGNGVKIRENEGVFNNPIVRQRISTRRLNERTGWHAQRTPEEAILDIINTRGMHPHSGKSD